MMILRYPRRVRAPRPGPLPTFALARRPGPRAALRPELRDLGPVPF